MAEAIDIAKRRAAEAEANRLKMPEISRWVDMTRKDFKGAKVKRVKEGAHSVGKPTGDYEVCARDMVLFVNCVKVEWKGKDEPKIQGYAGADFGKLAGKSRPRS